jgi:predicted transcriptional regulator of viral defense system
MQFIEFQNQLSEYYVFSLRDILKILPDFKRIQLDRWEKKGYLRKIKRGYYCFGSQGVNRDFLFYAANRIYAPSYVSLEMALKFYGLIPEEIFQITSVGTKKIASFDTGIGNFNYRHIKPSLYWGYRLADFDKQKILIAEPEKAILDYLYVHPNLKTSADFEGMRINADEFKTQINLEKFQKYLETIGSKQLFKRAKVFLITIQNDNA